MNTALVRYEGSDPLLRLILVMVAAIILNAIYCLIYTYSAGHPSSLSEALSWGAINLAPWVAAVEIGRQLVRGWHIAGLICAAGCVSLVLGFVYTGQLPNNFELVRRVPGAALTLVLLGGLAFYRKRKAAITQETIPTGGGTFPCDWARAAGNYVELHSQNGSPILLRSTLAGFVSRSDDRLTRIHRSFAVAPQAVDRIERAHVRLKDGTRLPIGNAYRDRLSAS